MIIKLAEHYGLCFGVRDALKQAEQLAQQAPLTILGELVHNPVVRDRLARHGVAEGSLNDFASAATRQVMITAHGASDVKRQEWKQAGFGLADGTCPLVRHAHGQLRMLVQLGYFPDAVVIEIASDIFKVPLRSHYGVISQTTQPIEHVRALVEEIRRAHPDAEVRFCDTVCKPTKDRQAALKKLLDEVDAMVVVGGRNSNNTRQLVHASQAAAKLVFHVERAEELRAEWFDGIERIGITAGTSTLQETVHAVHERLKVFAQEKRRATSAV